MVVVAARPARSGALAREQKTQGTGKVPAQMPKAAAAFPARVVDCNDGWREAHVVTVAAQATAKVHVLVVEEITRVEAAHFSKGLAAKKHEHARHPVRGERRGCYFVIKVRRQTQRFANQERDRREAEALSSVSPSGLTMRGAARPDRGICSSRINPGKGSSAILISGFSTQK